MLQGAAVVLGVQMSTICHRGHCRGSEGYGHWCHCGLLSTGRLHDGFHFNKWFTSHVRYTAALISRLVMPDIQRTVKRILPPSAVPSAPRTVAEVDETSTSDSCPTGQETSDQETSDQYDTEFEEFQNELRDFIQNLHTSPASEMPVSMLSHLMLKRVGVNGVFHHFSWTPS